MVNHQQEEEEVEEGCLVVEANMVNHREEQEEEEVCQVVEASMVNHLEEEDGEAFQVVEGDGFLVHIQ